jgi:hypothetical protein
MAFPKEHSHDRRQCRSQAKSAGTATGHDVL